MKRQFVMLFCACALVLALPVCAWADEVPSAEEEQQVAAAEAAEAVEATEVEAEAMEAEAIEAEAAEPAEPADPAVAEATESTEATGKLAGTGAEAVQDAKTTDADADVLATEVSEAEAEQTEEPEVQVATAASGGGVLTTSTKAPTTDKQTVAAPTATVSEGVYNIVSALRSDADLDVSGGSSKNSAKVQIYTDNTTPAQRWRLEALGDGYFKIVNVGSGKVLDVAGGRAKQGTRVQQYSWNGTNAQKWKVEATDAGFTITSALSPTLVLDVAGGNKNNSTQVQIWKSNSTPAQVWQFKKIEAELADGFYTLENEGSGKVLDISGGSLEDKGNAQQYSANATLAQTYQLSYNKNTGYYTIRNAGSGKVLDVSGGTNKNGNNVWQYSANNTKAQMWAISKNSNGSYTIKSATGGRALDVSGGSKNNSANVQIWNSNGTAAQKWKATKVSNWLPEGTYFIYSSKAHGNALTVAGNSVANNANIQMQAASSSNYQRFYLRPTSGGYYTIQNTYSGKYLDAAQAKSGANVAQTSTQEQWKPTLTNNGVVFQLKDNNNIVLDVSGGSTKAGANVQVYTANNTAAQKWLLKSTQILSDGYYTIAAASGTDFVFDNAGASKANGTELQVYKSNKTQAQRYQLKHLGSGKYQITNMASGKSLQVDGSKITQQITASKASQQWKPTLNANGTISFVSVANTKNKITLNGSAANTTKVTSAASNNKATQNWVVRSVSGGVTTYDTLSITLAQMAAIEGSDAYYINPNNGNKYRFLDLRTYTGSTGDQLDKAMLSLASWIGPGNPLYKTGKYFVEAAQKYNVNEVFLMAQACGETGWGASAYFGGYYNFYGVDGGTGTAAGAAGTAAQYGWTSIEKGIVGGAEYLANNWIYRNNYPQYSIYGLRYDYIYVDKTRQYSYHHYTTNDYWQTTLADTISKIYASTGTGGNADFVKPKYK